MQLNPEEVERFFAVWEPLIQFVNRRLRLAPAMLSADFDGLWDVRQVMRIRDALWADDALREAFIARNPAGLSGADLALVASWSHRKAGTFCVLKHLKKHSVLVGEDSAVYGILGLASTLGEVVPFTPCYVKAVLLPFGDRIVYDSLLAPYNVVLGPNYRRDLERTYQDARERGAVVTSLLPKGRAGPEGEKEEARSTDARVLDAFRKHLFRSGLSPKVVERDLASVAAFAEDCLLACPHPRSLRDFGPDAVRGFVTHGGPGNGRRKEVLTGLKRFLRFLRDTGRMDWHDAEEGLGVLKGE